MSSKVMKLYNKCAALPFGKNIFSLAFGIFAPYFLTIRAKVCELKPGHTEVRMNQRWAVQNHIKTVHAIAVCNLVEMSMGLVAEATIPKNLRWIPKGMDVQYLKKATGTLTATVNVDPDTIFTLEKFPGDVSIPVEVRDKDGVLVTSADVSYLNCLLCCVSA